MLGFILCNVFVCLLECVEGVFSLFLDAFGTCDTGCSYGDDVDAQCNFSCRGFLDFKVFHPLLHAVGTHLMTFFWVLKSWWLRKIIWFSKKTRFFFGCICAVYFCFVFFLQDFQLM